MNGLVSYLSLLILSLFFYSCASTKVNYTGNERYKPTRSVEILSPNPKQPYVVIATLEARSPSYENGEFVFEKMRNKAQQIGAHAIIPVEFYSIPDYSTAPVTPAYTPPRKPWKTPISNRVIRKPRSWAKAIAIRYFESEKEGKKEERETDSN